MNEARIVSENAGVLRARLRACFSTNRIIRIARSRRPRRDPRDRVAMVFETDSPFVAGRCRLTAGPSTRASRLCGQRWHDVEAETLLDVRDAREFTRYRRALRPVSRDPAHGFIGAGDPAIQIVAPCWASPPAGQTTVPSPARSPAARVSGLMLRTNLRKWDMILQPLQPLHDFATLCAQLLFEPGNA